MPYTTGVDIVEISRIESAISRWSGRFLQRVYTEEELKVSHGWAPALAARFAGKEAVMKALGTGANKIGWGEGVGWREVEILPDPKGKPLVYLHGRAQARAQELNLGEIAISLSHSREYAIASVVGGTQ